MKYTLAEICDHSIGRHVPKRPGLANIRRPRAAASNGTPMAQLLANRRFRFTVYRAARAPLLSSLIEMMWLQSDPYLMIPIRRRSANDVASYLTAGAVHHRDLLDALARRDSAAVAQAVRADISDSARAYRDLLAAHLDEKSAEESERRGRN